MKKFIAILLALALLIALPACGSEKPAASTPAAQLFEEFKTLVKDSPDATAEELAEKLSQSELLPFAGAFMAVEPGYLNGFSEDVDGFASGAVFAPMIGSIPFIGYVFELPADGDAAAFTAQLREKADLRWNICTEADEMLCESVGQTVFFVMSPANFDA